jgi:hypothetical protein
METKQTAIEWVEDELSNLNNLISNTRMTFEEYHKIRIEIWVKAKQMEKEQKLDFANKVLNESECSWTGIVYLNKDLVDIYNETYGK